MKRRGKLLYRVLGFVVAAVCLYAAFRHLDWVRFFETIRRSQPVFFCLAFAVSTASFCVRALRWSWFLGVWSTRIPFHWSFFALSSGFLINNFVPGRLGDVFRVLAVARKTRASRAYLLTGVFGERLLDVLSLQILFFVSLGIKGNVPFWFGRVAAVFAGLIGIAILAVVLLPRMEGLVLRILRRIPVIKRFQERFAAYYANAVKAVLVLRSAKNAAVLSIFSLVIWALDGVSTQLVSMGLGMAMDLPTVFIFLTAMAFAAAIPSTPGALGVLQVVGLLVLGPLGYAKETVLGFMLLWQGVAYGVSIVWGLLGLLVLRPGTATLTKPGNE